MQSSFRLMSITDVARVLDVLSGSGRVRGRARRRRKRGAGGDGDGSRRPLRRRGSAEDA